MQVALRFDLKVHHSVTRHLIEHVIEKRHPGSASALTAAVEIQTHRNPGFESISANFGLPHEDPVAKWHKKPLACTAEARCGRIKPAEVHDTIVGFRVFDLASRS
jgi:hypothetical protein